MRLELYLIAASIIAIALLRIHSFVNERYNGSEHYKHQISLLQQDLDHLELQAKLEQKKQFDHQQILALKMPGLIQKDQYNARNIASVLSAKEESLDLDYVSKHLDLAKEAFQIAKFEKVEALLQPVYETKTDHPLAPEAVFLLIEAKHFLNKKRQATAIIENMLRLYPESYLTGYSLLRLGDYFFEEGDEINAEYVFKLVAEKFSFDPQLVQSSEKKLRQLKNDSVY